MSSTPISILPSNQTKKTYKRIRPLAYLRSALLPPDTLLRHQRDMIHEEPELIHSAGVGDLAVQAVVREDSGD